MNHGHSKLCFRISIGHNKNLPGVSMDRRYDTIRLYGLCGVINNKW